MRELRVREREVTSPRSRRGERQSRAVNPGSLAPEALLFTNRLLSQVKYGYVSFACVCSSKRTGGGKGQLLLEITSQDSFWWPDSWTQIRTYT